MNGSDKPSIHPDSNGKLNGKPSSPPPIPHISNNILSLSNILRFYAQDSYKQVVTIIENLSTSTQTESDTSRKKKFLNSIISLRQDFLKLYTLVKWAQNSKDVSKLIDLLNWLRGQEFFFENLGYGLNELNSYSGAKLPNSDLLTSLEILIKGRPQLPSYNFLQPPPISTEKTLEVIEELNLVLNARIVLMDNIPSRFINNYEIKDGRIIFTVPNEFRVSLSVGSDLIVYDAEDYAKSPFFFLDFEFLFGINSETSLITYKDSKVITKLPAKSRDNLESVVKQTLQRFDLNGLYEVLHKYSISFKLYLISKQLRDLTVNSKWRNVVQFKYSSFLIIINYWSSHYLSRNWKSFIELGIEKSYNLNYRWFRNGKYYHDCSSLDSILATTGSEEGEISVDLILNTIVNKHAETLMTKIHEAVLSLLPEDSCIFLNSHQLLYHITPTKSTIFAINPLNGSFYFVDPFPIQNVITRKINSPPPNPRNKNLITEEDMIQNIASNLVQLKLETLSQEINYKLVTTEWISNSIIQLNDYETTKLFNFIMEKTTSYNKIQFHRCKNWPASWFLINLISGLSSKTYWWVARIKSIQGEWKIQWIQKLKFDEEELDYDFFSQLATVCSNMIIDHMIIEEVQSRHIKFVEINSKDALERFQLPADTSASSSIYESVIVLYNDDRLLPVENSSTSLFLKVRLVTAHNSTRLKLVLSSKFRNLPIKSNEDDFSKLNLSINGDMFEIEDSVDLSTRMNESENNNSLLENIFNNLNKLNQLIKILGQLNKSDIEVVNNQIHTITVNVSPSYQHFKLLLPDQESMPISIETTEGEAMVVQLLVKFLNRDLIENQASVIGCIKYLKEVIPFIESAKSVNSHLEKQNIPKLANGVTALNYDIKYQSLGMIQLIYTINYNPPTAPKKTLKDRIIINLSFASNKFDKNPQLYAKLSMRQNLNSRNLKYKALFETIFKAINDHDRADNNIKAKLGMIKFNYDYIVDPQVLGGLLIQISDCLLKYVQQSSL